MLCARVCSKSCVRPRQEMPILSVHLGPRCGRIVIVWVVWT